MTPESPSQIRDRRRAPLPFALSGLTESHPGNGPGTVNLAANGHNSRFAGEMIAGLPRGFTGVLEISSSSPFVALTLRSLVNARGDFLITTFPIADANQAAPSPIVFPQIADGAGYSTQFILFSGSAEQSSSGLLRFFGPHGQTLTLSIR